VDDLAHVRDQVASSMPEILEQLERLVAIPSVAFPGYPGEPVERMGDEVLRLFQEAGIPDASLQEVPDGYPPGSPTVVLYAHYDVQPAPPEQGWTSDPWTPTRKDDGRIYGRGAADDKGGIAIHLGTLSYFQGSLPCTVKLIVEGMEETNSNLESFVSAHPELFDCDLFIVCDMGNLAVGEPTLTTTLPGARRDDRARSSLGDPARRAGRRRGRGCVAVRVGRCRLLR
jgi:acetylornithine deacetylase/succinyl-diaminopimelate desuccinylase-like protein